MKLKAIVQNKSEKANEFKQLREKMMNNWGTMI
jgi:hypothetical protein